MRRAVLALGGTVAGLILLLSFRSHTAAPAAAGIAPGTATTPATSAAPSTPAPKATRTAGAGTGTGGAADGSRVVTGNVIDSAYGPSQVAVTLAAGKITKVTILQHTD